ncbi:MAG: hypothetical protein C0631_00855 [Sedimenticola sp.]|nr:MAG: hypothetical protein C0631_00855 [Sedimenticola sp.]
MKTLLSTLLSIFLLLPAVSTAEANFGYPNKYSNIADSLFDMMDAFASAFQKKKKEYNPEPNPAPMYQPGFNPGGYPSPGMQPYTPPYTAPYGGMPYGQQQWSNPLNGQWQSNTGEILVIRQNRFRIYRDRDNFHEGYLSIASEHTLIIQDPASGAAKQYEYAEQEYRLALQDESGNLLLFIRLGP